MARVGKGSYADRPVDASTAAPEDQGNSAPAIGDAAANADTLCMVHGCEALCSGAKCADGFAPEKALAETPCRIPPAPESSGRTLYSVRAERFAHVPRPLAKARSEFARRLAALFHEHWVRGETAYSKAAVARACDVAEKTVHEWCAGAKRMPPECIAKLPHQMFVEVVMLLQELHGQKPRRALLKIREGMTELPAELAHEDRVEVVKALVEIQGQAAELLKKAVG